MSVVILDKETNKHVTIAAAETNARPAPSFSGTGFKQDPMLFLEEFDKAAKWNNWRSDERKKEMFTLCLTGHAERWCKNNEAEFKSLPFEDNGDNEGLITKFKEKYLTEEWS